MTIDWLSSRHSSGRIGPNPTFDASEYELGSALALCDDTPIRGQDLRKVEFQYKHPDSERPADYVQVETLQFESDYGSPVFIPPIPAVGDTVTLTLSQSDRQQAYKVLTRHFNYLESNAGLYVFVNVVVTDVSM